jgi:hypothetical protein
MVATDGAGGGGEGKGGGTTGDGRRTGLEALPFFRAFRAADVVRTPAGVRLALEG